jgi:DNA-binding transcriptional LysR family regulator
MPALSRQRRTKPIPASESAVSREALRRVLHSRPLTYFLAVAESLSIRGAARRLNIASSAVNRQILMLEHAMGTALFERRGRSLALSPVGEVLAKKARETEANLDALMEEVDSLYALRSGAVRIASIDSFACGLLTDIVLAFSRTYPLIRISVTVQPSRATNALVANGDADIGFTINPPAWPDYETAAGFALDIGAIMAPDHPLAHRRKVTVKDCLAFPVLRGTRAETRLLIEQVRDKRNAVNNFIESNSSRFKATLVRRGDYIAFSPSLGLEQLIGEGKLVRVPLAKESCPSERFAVIVRSAGLGPAPKAFVDFSCKMVSQHYRKLDIRRETSNA